MPRLGRQLHKRRLYVGFPLEPAWNRRAFMAQKCRIEQLRLAARAVVGKDRHDGLAGAEILREPHRTRDIDRARSAEAEPLMLEQIEDERQRLLVGNEVGLLAFDV